MQFDKATSPVFRDLTRKRRKAVLERRISLSTRRTGKNFQPPGSPPALPDRCAKSGKPAPRHRRRGRGEPSPRRSETKIRGTINCVRRQGPRDLAIAARTCSRLDGPHRQAVASRKRHRLKREEPPDQRPGKAQALSWSTREHHHCRGLRANRPTSRACVKQNPPPDSTRRRDHSDSIREKLQESLGARRWCCPSSTRRRDEDEMKEKKAAAKTPSTRPCAVEEGIVAGGVRCVLRTIKAIEA